MRAVSLQSTYTSRMVEGVCKSQWRVSFGCVTVLCAFVPVCIGETRRRLCRSGMGCITCGCGFWGLSMVVGVARAKAQGTQLWCIGFFSMVEVFFASVLGSMRFRISVKLKYHVQFWNHIVGQY